MSPSYPWNIMPVSGNFDYIPPMPEMQLNPIYFYINLGVGLVFVGLGWYALNAEPKETTAGTRGAPLSFLTLEQKWYFFRFTGMVFFVGGVAYVSTLFLH